MISLKTTWREIRIFKVKISKHQNTWWFDEQKREMHGVDIGASLWGVVIWG